MASLLLLTLAACGSDNPGTGGPLPFGDGGGTGGTGGNGGSSGTTKGGSAGSGAVPEGGSGGSAQAGSDGGSGKAGANAGGSDPGVAPVDGVLFHVSCLPTIAGGDVQKAIRFAGTISAPAGGKRVVTLQALRIDAQALDDTVGTKVVGESAKGAGDGDPVSFSNVSVPGAANPISGSEMLFSTVQLGLVLAGAKDRPCAELDGQLTKPLDVDLSGSDSVDTCLFDAVESETTTVGRVKDANRFVPCEP